ncbi:MAG: hypothetical protein HYZ75_04415 [Elusimicrobia bacterium]|nr:hypothetical protein [Elusimicrobiota bacterium]
MNLPKTTTRVEEHTSPRVNARIRDAMERRISRYAKAPQAERKRRLEELDREWDIERAIEANAAGAVLLGLLLGRFVNSRFYAFPGMVASFLMLHALQGWCPPVPALRRLGFRTEHEIDEERRALEEIKRRRSHEPTQLSPF